MEGDKSRVKRGQLGVCCHSQGRDCVMGESVHYLPQPQSDSGNKGGSKGCETPQGSGTDRL